VKIPADPKSRQFLQLNRYRRERLTVHVYLLSGTRFTGRIRSFDVHTLLLETQQGEMVIYTHAISTIEQATSARGRRPSGAAGASGERRALSSAADRDLDGAPPQSPKIFQSRLGLIDRTGARSDRGALHERRAWSSSSMEMPPARDPDVELPAGGVFKPSAPTVTIVRRKSRLIPPRSDQ
jgi:host factor-I protein